MKLATEVCAVGVLLCAQLAMAGPAISLLGWNMTAGQKQSNESAVVSMTAGQQVVLHLKALRANYCQGLWVNPSLTLATETYVTVSPTVTTAYTARCFDTSNSSTDATVMVTVGGSGVDSIPPTVAFVTPANNATVTGNTIITINATDNVGVVGVLVSLDGTALGTEMVQPPYNMNWNTASATNGFHTLTAWARDAAGNTNQTSVAVMVNNGSIDTTPPTVQITAPYAGQTVSGQFSVTATASDNVGISWVRFQLDGADIQGAVLTVPPYTFVWNTASATNGPHTLAAVARDWTGNTATYFIGITINNAPMYAFTVLNPTASQTYQVGNQIIVAWTQHSQATSYMVASSQDGINYTFLTNVPLSAGITTFAWTPGPANATTTARIRVVAMLTNGTSTNADSGVFAITNPVPKTLETFLVTSPIGGAEFATGTPITVVWRPRSDMTVNNYLVDFSTTAGRVWTTASPTLSSGTLTYTYTPATTTLEGKFRVAANLTNGTTIFAESGIFRVTQTTPIPTFKITDVINAADVDPNTATRGVLVPGAWWSIYGTNFAASEVRSTTIPFPTRLGDIEVLVNGVATPLWFVRADQINFQVPYGISGQATLQVINRQGAVSQSVTLPVRPTAPSLFKYREGSGEIRAIVQNWSNGQLVTGSAPIWLPGGRFLILYGNAFGPVIDQWQLTAGQLSPASQLSDQAGTFILDGQAQQPTAITYVGLAPGMAGVFQVNLQLPSNLAAGRHAGVLVVNGTAIPFEFWTN